VRCFGINDAVRADTPTLYNAQTQGTRSWFTNQAAISGHRATEMFSEKSLKAWGESPESLDFAPKIHYFCKLF